jgi:hypothetical protein
VNNQQSPLGFLGLFTVILAHIIKTRTSNPTMSIESASPLSKIPVTIGDERRYFEAGDAKYVRLSLTDVRTCDEVNRSLQPTPAWAKGPGSTRLMLTAVNADDTPTVTNGSVYQVVVGNFTRSRIFLRPFYITAKTTSPELPHTFPRLEDTVKNVAGRNRPPTYRRQEAERGESEGTRGSNEQGGSGRGGSADNLSVGSYLSADPQGSLSGSGDNKASEDGGNQTMDEFINTINGYSFEGGQESQDLDTFMEESFGPF